MPSQASSTSTPAVSDGRVPGHVIAKLIIFALSLAILPITSYFYTIDKVFSGNATYAGATAGAVANVVLIGYIIVAFLEEDGQTIAEDKKETKKTK